MNIPNPFGAGNFDLTGESRHAKSARTTPEQQKSNSTPASRKDRKRRQKTPSTQLLPAPLPETTPVKYPFHIRVIRFIALAHLILGITYAASLTFRFSAHFISEESNPFFLLGLSVLLAPIYLILESIIGAWCETVNDILFGAVDCWPEFLTLEKFFNQLSAECEADITRILSGQIITPDAATFPHRPKIDPSGQSFLYLATYLSCLSFTPLSALIKFIFWRVEITFGILFLAYLFTSSAHQSQR